MKYLHTNYEDKPPILHKDLKPPNVQKDKLSKLSI